MPQKEVPHSVQTFPLKLPKSWKTVFFKKSCLINIFFWTCKIQLLSPWRKFSRLDWKFSDQLLQIFSCFDILNLYTIFKWFVRVVEYSFVDHVEKFPVKADRFTFRFRNCFGRNSFVKTLFSVKIYFWTSKTQVWVTCRKNFRQTANFH